MSPARAHAVHVAAACAGFAVLCAVPVTLGYLGGRRVEAYCASVAGAPLASAREEARRRGLAVTEDTLLHLGDGDQFDGAETIERRDRWFRARAARSDEPIVTVTSASGPLAVIASLTGFSADCAVDHRGGRIVAGRLRGDRAAWDLAAHAPHDAR